VLSAPGSEYDPQMVFGSRIATDRLCLSVMVVFSDVVREAGGRREGRGGVIEREEERKRERGKGR